MPELFDTTRVPDDPAHWDAVAARIAARATGGRRREPTLAVLGASRVGWIAASLLLAAALGYTLRDVPAASAANLGSAWTSALAPSDDVGSAIVGGAQPPSLDALLLGRAAGGR